MSAPRPQVTVSITLPAAVFSGLVDLARKAGQPRDIYTANLLIAAYSAKRGPTGDSALEESVRAPMNAARVEQVVVSMEADMAPLMRELERWKKVAEEFRLRGEQADHIQEQLNNLRAEKEQLRQSLKAVQAQRDQFEQELAEEIALRVGAIDRMKKAELERDELLASSGPKKTVRSDQPLTGTEIGFVPPEALPAREITAGLADCTRRMIISLKACGLKPGEIARDTDTPLHVVKAVLDQQATRRRA